MMDYDDYLISTHRIDAGDVDEDGNTIDDVPSAWTYIAEAPSDEWEGRQIDLCDWLDVRVTEMLGEDGADHMDTRALVAHWVLNGYVETMCGMWWFTRDSEAKQWLAPKA